MIGRRVSSYKFIITFPPTSTRYITNCGEYCIFWCCTIITQISLQKNGGLVDKKSNCSWKSYCHVKLKNGGLTLTFNHFIPFSWRTVSTWIGCLFIDLFLLKVELTWPVLDLLHGLWTQSGPKWINRLGRLDNSLIWS